MESPVLWIGVEDRVEKAEDTAVIEAAAASRPQTLLSIYFL